MHTRTESKARRPPHNYIIHFYSCFFYHWSRDLLEEKKNVRAIQRRVQKEKDQLPKNIPWLIFPKYVAYSRKI